MWGEGACDFLGWLETTRRELSVGTENPEGTTHLLENARAKRQSQSEKPKHHMLQTLGKKIDKIRKKISRKQKFQRARWDGPFSATAASFCELVNFGTKNE